MAAEIRLKLNVSGGDAAISGLNEAIRGIDSSIQYGVQRINSQIDSLVTKADASFKTIAFDLNRNLGASFSSIGAQIDSLILKIGKLQSVGGAAGAGGGGAGRQKLPKDISAEIDQMIAQRGLELSRQRLTATGAGTKQLDTYLGAGASLQTDGKTRAVLTIADQAFRDRKLKEMTDFITTAGGTVVSEKVMEVGAGGKQKVLKTIEDAQGRIWRYLDDQINSTVSNLKSVAPPKQVFRDYSANTRDLDRGLEAMARDADKKMAISQSLQASQDFLGAGGFNLTGRQTVSGPNGTYSIAQYENLYGETAKVNEKLGTMRTSLMENHSMWETMGIKGRAALDKVGAGLGFVSRPLEMIHDGIGRVTMGMLQLAGTIYTIRNTGRIIESALITPFEEVYQNIFRATEQYRQFQASIIGIAGGAVRAGAIGDATARASMNSPIGMEDMQSLVRRMAFNPETSNLIVGEKSQQKLQENIAQFATLISKLKLMNPDEGDEAIIRAVNNAVLGNTRGMLSILKISPQELATEAGKSTKGLKADGSAVLPALTSIVNRYVPDSSLDAANNLISVQLKKVYDALDYGLHIIGDSGVYDAWTGILHKASMEMMAFFKTDEFKAHAVSMSDSLDGILTNMLGGVTNFIRAITGNTDEGSSISTFTSAFDDFLKKVKSFSNDLPGYGTKLGEFVYAWKDELSDLINHLEWAVEQVARIASYLPGKSDASFDGRNVAIGNMLSSRFGIQQTPGSAPSSSVGDVSKWSLLQMAAGPALGPFLPGVSSSIPAGPSSFRDGSGNPLTAAQQKSLNDLLGQADVRNLSGGPAVMNMQQMMAAVQSATGMKPKPLVSGLSGNAPLSDLGAPSLMAQTNALDTLLDPLNSYGSASSGTGKHGDGGIGLLDKYDALMNSDIVGMLKNLQGVSTKGPDGKWSMSPDGTAAASGRLASTTKNFGVGFTANAGTIPPEIANAFFEQIAAGTTSLSLLIKSKLEKSGDDMDSEQMTKFLNAWTVNIASRFAQESKFGVLTGTQSPDEIQRRVSGTHGGMLLDAQRNELSAYATESNAALANYNQASQKASGTGNRADIAEAQAAELQYAQLLEKIKELELEMNPLAKMFTTLGDDIEKSFTNRLGDAFDGLITGSKKLGDVVRAMVSDIVSSFSHLAAQTAVNAITSRTGGLGSIFGSLIGSYLGGGGAAYSGGGAAPTWSVHANGGIIGPWTPLHKFADGGIVSGSSGGTLGMIGERGYGFNEAVVPLPNGSAIPIQLLGGGSSPHAEDQAPKIFVVNSPAQAWAAGYSDQGNRDLIIDHVAGNVRKGGKVFSAIKSK